MQDSCTALCAAIGIEADSGAAPEWLHLLPAGKALTRDGRGPYHVADAARLIAESMAAAGNKMVLCENHATDLSAPKGGAAPARGWIVDLQERADGIWGRVSWTEEGRRLVEDQAYRGVSPVISHASDGAIVRILRASLVNQPNILGLTSLHMTVPVAHKMDAIDKSIAAYLGLDPEKYSQLMTGSPDFVRQIEPMRNAIVNGKLDLTSLKPSMHQNETNQEFMLRHLNKSKENSVNNFRDKVIQALGLGFHATDDEVMDRIWQMKNGTQAAQNTSLQAQNISMKATAYQKRLADIGQNIDFATAVGAVMSGEVHI